MVMILHEVEISLKQRQGAKFLICIGKYLALGVLFHHKQSTLVKIYRKKKRISVCLCQYCTIQTKILEC